MKLDVRDMCKKSINNFFNQKEFDGLSEIETDYIEYLLFKSIDRGSRLRKNDVSDFLIVSSSYYIDQALVSEEEFFVLTFDKVMFEFLKQYNHMFNQNIYESLRIGFK